MGELIENTHTYSFPYTDELLTLKTKWEYDSWNRVKQITYPDGEQLDYHYNLGGMLKSMLGSKSGVITRYIDSINYDQYEQRTFEAYGNKVKTNYIYDPITRRLDSLKTYSQQQSLQLQKNKYKYDYVGNIKQIQGNGCNNFYNYDQIYRLTSSVGSGNWNGTSRIYNMSMNYSPSGRIDKKDMTSQRLNNQGAYNVNYINVYTYGYNGNPYALNHIQELNSGLVENLQWDSKGNMIHHLTSTNERYLCWTEDNRMQAFMDNKNAAYYNYDASGERNLKLTGGVVQTTQNGVPFYSPFLEDPTLYASGLITINKKGYTKHYFEESKRICSKIGGGFSNATYNINTPITPITPYTEHGDILKNGLYTTFSNCIGKSVKTDDAAYKIYNAMAHVKGLNNAELTFYYNSDHLGSSSYITNDTGSVTQTLAYLPYGESWIDIDNQPPYLSPYKFNGKEKDEETSYNYYGARYYTDYLSIWLSVDPKSDKYPNLSSYTYCANSPVMLIDPNGEDVWINGEASQKSTNQLPKSLKITRDENSGKLSCSGKPTNSSEEVIYNAIRSKKVKVHIQANNSNEGVSTNPKDKGMRIEHSGGAFLGNNIEDTKDGKIVNTYQMVNPDALAELDNCGGGYPGQSMQHELSESYIGGVNSLIDGDEARNGSNYSTTTGNSRYDDAHNAAIPQPYCLPKFSLRSNNPIFGEIIRSADKILKRKR